MVFLMSGMDGSIGYSFFSERVTLMNLELLGEELEFEDDDRDGDCGGELEFEVAVDTESLVVRNFSRENFKSWNFGDTTITSIG